MQKRVSRFFAFALVLLLLLPAAITNAQDTESFIQYPITADPEHMNPFISDTITIGTVTNNIFEGLTRYNPISGEVEPAIAESWEVTENADGQQVYTFNLREGVLFHEVAGVEYTDREVTADDILWNYELALNGDEEVSILAAQLEFILGAPEFTAGEAETVAGLNVVDDYTFEITLAEPDRLFLINGMISITSPEAYEQLGDEFDSTPVGTGPYRFVEWLRDDRVVLEANPDYYVEGLPRNDGIVFTNYGDANTALLDYREGNLDFLFSFPSGQRSAIISEFTEEYNEEAGLHVRYWGFNMNNGFFAENPLVRQAFAHALDRESAWNVFEEGARFPADQGMLPPAMPASTPASTYPFDLERAAELLAEAGFPNGEGMPTIRINLLESISGEAQVVLWQEALTSLGVNVELDVQDGSTYWDSIVTDETMIFQNGWAAGLLDPSDVFDFLILDGNGSMRYDNPEVNELLRQARVESDPAVREELYQQVHDIVMADAVVIPSAYSKITWLQKPWVNGFEPGGGGIHTARLANVELGERG
ncbi:MAG: ABC transporter substrate-binding protein [Anaerolineae bacterium]